MLCSIENVTDTQLVKKLLAFDETRKSSLSCSEESTNGSHPQPCESSPPPQILFLKIYVNIILLAMPTSPKRSLSFKICTY